MEEVYLNETLQNTNEENEIHEVSASSVVENSISTSELIQKETNLLIEENIKSSIQIQQLVSNLNEASETIDLQRSEILNLQAKFEGITELYKLEISKREEVDERISYMKHVSEASLKELNTLVERASNIDKDKIQLESIITSFKERTESIEDGVLSFTEKSAAIIQDLEEQLNSFKIKNEQDQLTIEKAKMENDNFKLKINNLEQNMEQLLKQLDENKKIADEEIENCRRKLGETEFKLQEVYNEKIQISTQLKEIEKNLTEEVENVTKLNETITHLTKEKNDFQEQNEKLSSEIKNIKNLEKSLTEELSKLQVRFDQVNNDNKNSCKIIEDKIKIIEIKNVEISTNLLLINDLNNNLDSKDNYIDQLKTQINHLQNEIGDLNTEIKNQQNILEEKTVEFENISKQLNNDIETEKLNCESVNKKNMDLQQELSKYREMHDTVIREYCDTLQINETEYNKKIEDLTNKSNDIKEQMTVQINEKQQKIDKLQEEINEMKTKIDEYSKEVKNLKEKLEEANKNNDLFIVDDDIPTQSEEDIDITPNIDMKHSTPKSDKEGNSDTDSSQASFRFNTQILSRRTNPFSTNQFGTKRKNTLDPPNSKRMNIFSIPDSSSSGDKNAKDTKKNTKVFRNTK